MTNPLLNFDGLPSFSSIKAEHVIPALNDVLADCRSTITQLSNLDKPEWQNFASVLEDLDEKISRVWSPIGHLNAVKDNDELRAAYQQGIALITQYHSEVGQNSALYQQYKKLKNQSGYSAYSQAKRKIIDNTLLDFRLSGAELAENDKARFTQLSLQLAELSNKFERNLLDSTQAWTLLITDQELLKGMPASSLAMAQSLAKESNQDGWLLNLQIPSYLAVMQHVENTELRKQVYQAYVMRASELSNEGKFDNTSLIDDILAARLEQANLLGFDNYAELSLQKKMAKSSTAVIKFLNDLVHYAKPVAQQELQELQAFAQEQYGVNDLQAWDLSFYSERLREQQYAFSNEQVKAYFPAPQVFNGLFEIINRLFEVTITPNQEMESWHDDVTSYDVLNADNELIGQLFADIYVRKNKRGGAWMDVCLNRRRTHNSLQLPVAFLVCNFAPPVDDIPALLTHDEVETLFHEFGHTLHHLLTQVDEMSVAGINGVAWDAVELPSQFLENWCWQDQSLQLIAKHYQSGDSIPAELLAKMHAAKNFQSGMQALRQVEFSLFDMLIHSEYQPSDSATVVQSILDQVRSQIAVINTPDYNRFQNSFGHIFSGGYAAGYYSYKWAEVLSADAFGRFQEEGIFNQQTGKDFLHSILERGGEDDANQLFIDFRGREPQIEPLLRQTGILV
ncbi:UNVERIFIED_CONTAM: hypothetical protein GTU68_043189 [Idotea baltica]|nr:hypothetical protein [Idotea baltica]